MLVKEKFYKVILIKKSSLFFLIVLNYFTFIDYSFASLADLREIIVSKIAKTKTLSFNFKQTIAEKEEIGNCFIKYPLLMRCKYDNKNQKIIISNGKTFAIIKKKYKKIYYYPLRTTLLFTILKKEKILNLVKNNYPTYTDSKIIEFQLVNKERKKKIKIFFDKNSLELKGWETKDAYSNNVSFIISNLKINNQIEDSFFKIPSENDL